MAWIGAVIGLAGAAMSQQSSDKAAGAMKYQPWTTTFDGVGQANFKNGQLSLYQDANNSILNNALGGQATDALGRYGDYQQNALGQGFLRNAYVNSNMGSSLYGVNPGTPSPFFGNTGNMFQQQSQMGAGLGTNALLSSQGGYGANNFLGAGQSLLGSYQPQDFNNLRGNMIGNFDPNQAASNYTDLLRQQAQPQEQQAVASQMDSLFGNGRLGTTGGATMMGQLSQAQQQADIQRQVAGQQFGLNQQIQAQQGLDQALNAEQGRQIGGYNANQAGMANTFGLASQLGTTGAGLYGSSLQNALQGLNVGQSADSYGFNRLMGLSNTDYSRNLDLNNTNYNRTQDAFGRSMQLFGADNAYGQQQLSDLSNFMGMQQSNNQQLMDLARIGASVGQSQTTANANAAAMRNQGTQDMLAGFMQAYSQYNANKKNAQVATNGK